MTFEKNEKELLRSLVQEHLDAIKATERLPNQDLLDLAGEVQYEEFLAKILKKI